MGARILFVGSKRIGVRCLARARDVAEIAGIVTLDDRSDARNEFDLLAAQAQEAGTGFHVVSSSDQLASVIDGCAPDLALVVGWYRIIPPALLDAVPRGFVGLHASLLPKYRGGSPLVWAIINGETETGVTLFQFSPGMDDGDVWGQERLPIGADDTIAEVLARAEDAAVHLVASDLDGILSGRARPHAQDHAAATYCAQRTPDDGEVDWRWPARRVHDFVRAQSDPYPGAFTTYDGRRIVLQRTSVPAVVFHGTPGQVLRRDGEGVWIACGDDRPLLVRSIGTRDSAVPAGEVLTSLNARLGR